MDSLAHLVVKSDKRKSHFDKSLKHRHLQVEIFG